MINAIQLRMEIIRPVLEYLDPVIPYSVAAENLLMGTCAQESRMGSYVKQVSGPACGIFQMEPATHNDICENFLEYRPGLDDLTNELRARGITPGSKLSDLVGNLYYQVAMTRVHYVRVRMALPEEDNVEEQANYWKLFYNTPEGKGTVEEFIENYNRYVA